MGKPLEGGARLPAARKGHGCGAPARGRLPLRPQLREFGEVGLGHCRSDKRERKRCALNPVVEKVAEWRDAEKKVALATVVKVERSGPLGPGTSMAVSEGGQVAGLA